MHPKHSTQYRLLSNSLPLVTAHRWGIEDTGAKIEPFTPPPNHELRLTLNDKRANRFRREFLRTLTVGAALGALPACVTQNVATGRKSFTGTLSVDDDIRIGKTEHPRLLAEFGGEYGNRRIQRYVDRIGKRLAPFTEYQAYPYRFTVLNSPIVNAFALPGGFVYVSRGLLALAANEAEVAGVVAHELGHVNARHGAERRSAATLAQLGVLAAALGGAALGVDPSTTARLGQGIAVMAIQGYSRSQEFEADRLGVRYMARGGYDPGAMVSFLTTLRSQSQVEAELLGLPPGSVDQYNFMSTHPRTVDRVKAATEAAAVSRPAPARIARDDHLTALDGMLFGDDPSQGLIIGRRFTHPGLRFEFEVPEGFRLTNAASNVSARGADGAAIVFDIAKAKAAAHPAQYIRSEWARGAELRGIERLRLDGREAATALAAANTPQGAADIRLVAVRRDARSYYRFLFVSPGGETRARSTSYLTTVESFRRLTPDEASRIKPLRLLVVSSQPGDKVSTLAKRLPYGRANARWFRIMNDLPPGAEPKPKQRIKVIAS